MENMCTESCSVESLHFRFFADRPAQQKVLSQSLNRTANELLSLFGTTCRLIIDVASSPDISNYPFTKANNTHVTENTGFDFSVYSNGHVISGDPSASNNMNELPNQDFLSLLYKEQFVFRVEVRVDLERSSIDAFQNAMENLIDNATMPGVSLLSIESTNSTMIDSVELMLRAGKNASQPLLGLKNEEPKLHSLNKVVGSDSLNDLSASIHSMIQSQSGYTAQVNGKDSFDLDGRKTSLLTIVTEKLTPRESEDRRVGIVGSHRGVMVFPTWVKFGLVMKGERRTFLSRIVEVPEFLSVEEGFENCRSYPVNHFFSDLEGAEYVRVLEKMEGDVFFNLMESGFDLSHRVMPNGNVLFTSSVSYVGDEKLENRVIFEGGEIDTTVFLKKLINSLSDGEYFQASDIIANADYINVTNIRA
ncbi:MAG: hypothetical protein CBC55_05285 [Gammaproteobacteria bacterium TMED95]|nr:MAG: hypothetical protein CBC55_05285 [Gammaproteobacteria bacterium TMED95]